MGLAADVTSGIQDVLAAEWQVRAGTVVPESDQIVLKNGAVRLDATYLYADMADSTGLAQRYRPEAVAKVIRCYLNAATRIIRHHGGAIRSFDGDRVMGIFVGGRKNNTAVTCARQIHWAVHKVINPQLQAKWSDLKWTMDHGIGVDTGEALLVRGGVHGENDLVSVGSAPNVAAKLSELRRYSINVSAATFGVLEEPLLKTPAGEPMWTDQGTMLFGGKSVRVHGSNWYRGPA